QAVGDTGHTGAAVAVQAGAEEAEFAELRNKMHGESGFAAVLFDDRNDFVFDEFSGGLADELFFVVKLGIKIDVIHSGVLGHAASSLGSTNGLQTTFLGYGKRFPVL